MMKFVCLNSQPKAETGSNVPHPRSAHCSATDGINIFVFGGHNTNDRSTTEMWCFNLCTETWHRVETVGDAPSETCHMSMLRSGDQLLLFGGVTEPESESRNTDIITFSLKDKTWSTLACGGQRPSARHKQAMILHEGSLYLFGGCSSFTHGERSFYSDLWCLDLRSRAWSLLSGTDSTSDPNAPTTTLFSHNLAYHDNKLYIVGSQRGKFYSIHLRDKIYIYNMGTNKWSIHTVEGECPCDRSEYSLVQWKNEVYMCGGRRFHNIQDDLWKLDLLSLQWSQLPATLPVPTYGHSAVITPDKCMYVFGGTTHLPVRATTPDGTKRTNAAYKIWLETPSFSLQDMALGKVLALLRDKTPETILKLRDLGLPPNVVERLKHLE